MTYSEETAELREQVVNELFGTIGKSHYFDQLVNRRLLVKFPSIVDVDKDSHLYQEVVASVWHELSAEFIKAQ